MAGLGDLVLGSLVSRGADRLLNPEQRNNKIIDSLIPGGGITGQGTSGKSKGKSTLGGIAKQGILGLIAKSILGPILGPLALTLGQNFLGKNPNITKGLGFFNKGDGITKGPPGIPKGPVIDPDTPSDEGFQVTGDYAGNDFFSAEGTTVDSVTGDLTDASGNYAGNINDEFGVSPTTTTTSAPDPRDRGGSDSDGNGGGGGGGGGGGSPGSAGPGGSDEMGSFRYGGRASYSGGGLASLL